MNATPFNDKFLDALKKIDRWRIVDAAFSWRGISLMIVGARLRT